MICWKYQRASASLRCCGKSELAGRDPRRALRQAGQRPAREARRDEASTRALATCLGAPDALEELAALGEFHHDAQVRLGDVHLSEAHDVGVLERPAEHGAGPGDEGGTAGRASGMCACAVPAAPAAGWRGPTPGQRRLWYMERPDHADASPGAAREPRLWFRISRSTCLVICDPRGRNLMATCSPVSLSLASIAWPKFPFPSSRMSSYCGPWWRGGQRVGQRYTMRCTDDQIACSGASHPGLALELLPRVRHGRAPSPRPGPSEGILIALR